MQILEYVNRRFLLCMGDKCSCIQFGLVGPTFIFKCKIHNVTLSSDGYSYVCLDNVDMRLLVLISSRCKSSKLEAKIKEDIPVEECAAYGAFNTQQTGGLL